MSVTIFRQSPPLWCSYFLLYYFVVHPAIIILTDFRPHDPHDHLLYFLRKILLIKMFPRSHVSRRQEAEQCACGFFFYFSAAATCFCAPVLMLPGRLHTSFSSV